MSSRLIDSLATTDALAGIFSDRSLVQAMLDFEAALAGAEAKAGVIPASAAASIAAAASADGIDGAAIARDARASGTVSIPLVKALTARVHAADAESARYVHFGATSQDVSDSAMALAIGRARATLAADHDRLERGLRQLSDSHAGTVMLGRTLLQPAPPITFGLKVAHWVAALTRGWARINAAVDTAAILQFGGASGTLAALGDRGPAVSRALADDLGLRAPEAPWHAHRDRLAALVAACGIYTGTLGKIARDVSLLMQDETSEVAEPGGGSSTMPNKRNPAGCAIALAAATRLPGLVAAFLTGMVQEHERAVGGWHAEWPTIAAAIQTTGSALAAMVDVVGRLVRRRRPNARQHRKFQRGNLRGTRDDALDTERRQGGRDPIRHRGVEREPRERNEPSRGASRHARHHARDSRGPAAHDRRSRSLSWSRRGDARATVEP